MLHALADGNFHSGEVLAGELGVTRATVWNIVRRARSLGIGVQRVPGRGYRLSGTFSLLDAERIRARLTRAGLFPEVIEHIGSTNSELMRRAQAGAAHGAALFAEVQDAGRGRRGRAWVSQAGGSLTFSLLWRSETGLAAMSGISLAVGLALARALGHHGVELKWPNDVLHGYRKLAGVLVEAQGEALGPAFAVIGIGVNVRLSEQSRDAIAQPVTDLDRLGAGHVDRNELAARLLDHLDEVLECFRIHGLEPLIGEWNVRHAYHRKPVRLVLAGGGEVRGVVLGVTSQGALRIEHDTGIQDYHAGEISLRPLKAH